jgi:hypothetical protein
MPDNLPNPELYPPYSNQTYVKVHTMNTYGVGNNPYVQTLRQYVNGTDVYPDGTSWTATAKYQIWMGGYGLVWTNSQVAPYNTRNSAGTGQPMAFSSLAAAQYALSQCTFAGNNSGEYSFWGRNPRFEMAQALDAYKQNSDEFDYVDSLITARLTARSVTNAGAVYNFIASKVVNQDSNQQYALGLSAASGGGQNTTYIANSISASQYQAFAEAALKTAFEIPIVTPFESPLIAESHSQGVEAKNAGEIRDQQIRQAIASAGGVMGGIAKAEAGGTNWAGWDGASILIGAYGQAGAANQT